MGGRLSLGNQLTRAIYRRTLTDAELATRAGISRAHLNRIRNGRVVPRVGTAIALASALGCRVHDIFYLKG